MWYSTVWEIFTRPADTSIGLQVYICNATKHTDISPLLRSAVVPPRTSTLPSRRWTAPWLRSAYNQHGRESPFPWRRGGDWAASRMHRPPASSRAQPSDEVAWREVSCRFCPWRRWIRSSVQRSEGLIIHAHTRVEWEPVIGKQGRGPRPGWVKSRDLD